MTEKKLTAAQLAEIETNRETTGRFGEREHTGPEGGLPGRPGELTATQATIAKHLNYNDPWRKDPARLSRFGLAALVEPGNETLGALIRTRGPEGALEELVNGTATEVDGMPLAPLRARLDERDAVEQAARHVRDTRQKNFGFTTPEDPSYPDQLSDLGDAAPVALWTDGDASLMDDMENLITIGGSRAASGPGLQAVNAIARATAGKGRVLVSGIDFGINGETHRAAFSAGTKSILVLPSGPGIVDPPAHAALARHVAKTGLIISECPPYTTPARSRHMDQTRITAALSWTTVIAEAGPRSASMTTARTAHRLGRRVFAAPGRVTDVESTGSNQLISEGVAQILTGPEALS